MSHPVLHELTHHRYLRERLEAAFPDADEETLMDLRPRRSVAVPRQEMKSADVLPIQNRPKAGLRSQRHRNYETNPFSSIVRSPLQYIQL